jgi:hypothetical protein
MKHYRSGIPKAARERVVATFINSPRKYRAEYILHGEVVGIRQFHETGDQEYERPLRNGVTHGIEYRSDVPGKLLSAEPYSNGLPHGIARQWSDEGRLIGTYSMKHGTGLDLWWCQHGENGSPYLSEARCLKGGKWDGFEWWLNPGRKSVWEERHFRENQDAWHRAIVESERRSTAGLSEVLGRQSACFQAAIPGGMRQGSFSPAFSPSRQSTSKKFSSRGQRCAAVECQQIEAVQGL